VAVRLKRTLRRGSPRPTLYFRAAFGCLGGITTLIGCDCFDTLIGCDIFKTLMVVRYFGTVMVCGGFWCCASTVPDSTKAATPSVALIAGRFIAT